MNASNRRDRFLNRLGNIRVRLGGDNICDLSRVMVKNLTNSLVRTILGNSIKCVLELGPVQTGSHLFSHGFVALAVVNNRVALASVNQPLHMLLGATGDADEGVNVGTFGELNGV